MPWFKVKSLNFIPSFNGMDNLVTTAIVEFGLTSDGVDQVAFAKEVDLLESASFEGNYLPLHDIDQAKAVAFITGVLGEAELEHLMLKAEISLMNTETVFLA